MQQQPQRVVVTLTLEATVELATLSAKAFWQNRFVGPSVTVVEVSARAEQATSAPSASKKAAARKKPGR